MRQLLESAQFGEVMEAENGREAIDKAQDRKPDIVILDLVMPVMDGLVAARELSKNLMPGVPLLMYDFAIVSPQVELEAQKVGCAKSDCESGQQGSDFRDPGNTYLGFSRRNDRRARDGGTSESSSR